MNLQTGSTLHRAPDNVGHFSIVLPVVKIAGLDQVLYVKNPARNELDLGPDSKPGAPFMLFVTVAAFGGTFVLYGVEPWGAPAAMALLAAWAMVLLAIAAQQDRRDKIAGEIPDVPPRKSSTLARFLQGLFLIGGMASFGYATWLQRNGVAREISQPWSDGALFVLPLGMFVGWATDVIIAQVSRLRPPKI